MLSSSVIALGFNGKQELKELHVEIYCAMLSVDAGAQIDV